MKAMVSIAARCCACFFLLVLTSLLHYKSLLVLGLFNGYFFPWLVSFAAFFLSYFVSLWSTIIGFQENQKSIREVLKTKGISGQREARCSNSRLLMWLKTGVSSYQLKHRIGPQYVSFKIL